MAEPLLATAGLTKRFGGLVAASEVALSVEPGEIHAVIGPNGAGKTTLVAALAGELRPDAGTIRFLGHDISRLGPARRAARGDKLLREPARAVLAEVGLAERADVTASALAHGEKRALEIAMVLATRPRLLLLDEPMAGMGPAESAEIVDLLARLRGRFAIVLVEHDMDAVFALADRITVMVYGRVIATGAPDAIRADPEVRRAYLGDEDA